MWYIYDHAMLKVYGPQWLNQYPTADRVGVSETWKYVDT